MSGLTEDFPTAIDMYMHFFADWQQHVLDAGEVMVHGISHWKHPDGPPYPVAAELERLLERFPNAAEHRDVVERFHTFNPLPPEIDWRPWARLAQRWAQTGIVAGQPIREVDSGAYPPPLPRATRFTDKQAAETAITEVVRTHLEQIAAWQAGQPHTPRLHLNTDLARPIGTGVTAPDGDRADFTAVTVVMARTWRPQTPRWVHAEPTDFDGVHVLTAYPDTALDPDVRARYPDLPHLLGGHFGQDYPEETAWRAEVAFHLGVTDHTRTQIATQLTRLLDDTAEQPDDELVRRLDALGCYLRPAQPRAWLRRLLERFDPDLWQRLPPDQAMIGG